MNIDGSEETHAPDDAEAFLSMLEENFNFPEEPINERESSPEQNDWSASPSQDQENFPVVTSEY